MLPASPLRLHALYSAIGAHYPPVAVTVWHIVELHGDDAAAVEPGFLWHDDAVNVGRLAPEQLAQAIGALVFGPTTSLRCLVGCDTHDSLAFAPVRPVCIGGDIANNKQILHGVHTLLELNGLLHCSRHGGMRQCVYSVRCIFCVIIIDV